MIGPRLIDPRAKTNELLDLFRFADQRAKVEEILKARATAMAVNIYKNSPSTSTPGGGGRGAGRGGRGGLALPPGRKSTGTAAKTENTPGSSSELDTAAGDRPPPSEVTTPHTPNTPGPTTNSDNSSTNEENGALGLLQRPSRGITFVDNRKSSFALKKVPTAEPTTVSAIRKSADSKPSSNGGTPLMRSATNSRRPSNTGESIESVTRGISSLLGEEAKSFSSLDGYATPPRSNAGK